MQGEGELSMRNGGRFCYTGLPADTFKHFGR